MTKWVALGLGALLALAGAVCIGLGYDGVQTARGGVLVIAGAIALTGGVLIFALFAVLGELQASLAGRSMDGAGVTPEPLPETVPEPPHLKSFAPAVAAPVAPPSPAKTLEPLEPPAPEQAAPAVPAKPTAPEPRVWERPSPFRASSPGADRSLAPAVVASGAVVAGAAVLAEAAAPVLRKDEEPVSEAPVVETVVEAAPAEVELEDHVERAIALALADESLESPAQAEDVAHAPDNHDAPSEEPPRQSSGLRAALGLQDLPPHEPHQPSSEAPPQDDMAAVQEPKPEPRPAPSPLIEVDASPSVAAGYAWLEKALASDDGRKSPALEWLRARQRSAPGSEPVRGGVPPPPLRVASTPPPADEPAAEAAPEEPRAVEPEIEAAPEPAVLHEPAPEVTSEQDHAAEAPAQIAQEDAAALEVASEPTAHDASVEQEAPTHEPTLAAAPEPEPELHTEPPSPAPTIIGRYSSGGSDFTLYSDGSIDAQTDQGMFHYGSMAELRAHIESMNAQG